MDADEIQSEIDAIQNRRHFLGTIGAGQVHALPANFREDYQRLALLVRDAKRRGLDVTVPTAYRVPVDRNTSVSVEGRLHVSDPRLKINPLRRV